MNITMILHVSQKEFFEYLTQSIMIDIFKNTNVFKCKEEIIPGLTYKKKIKNANHTESNVHVELIEYQTPSLYKSKITNNFNINTITFECNEINENQVQIIYTENYDSTKKLQLINYYFVSFILSKTMKKKIKNMLLAMEKHIMVSHYE